MKKILPLLLAVPFSACNMNKGTSTLRDTTNSKYHVGEEYTFKARPFEPNAMITVEKVEHQDSTGNIIHVRVDNVKMKTSENPVKFSEIIKHMPFSEAALDSSSLRKIGMAKVTHDYQEGYNEWRTSFEKGRAGVFSIPVGESVEYMEETMLKGRTVKE